MKVPLTLHQRMMRASRRKTGIHLSADDVELLTVWDDVIPTQAEADDRRAAELSKPPTKTAP